jgi:hypothetical protein
VPQDLGGFDLNETNINYGRSGDMAALQLLL